jgi:hypothetical protein
MLDLYRQDRMKFAGAFADHTGGAAAFEAADDETARSIVVADPAVSMGTLTCTVQRWNLLDWASLVSSAQRATARPLSLSGAASGLDRWTRNRPAISSLGGAPYRSSTRGWLKVKGGADLAGGCCHCC